MPASDAGAVPPVVPGPRAEAVGTGGLDSPRWSGHAVAAPPPAAERDPAVPGPRRPTGPAGRIGTPPAGLRRPPGTEHAKPGLPPGGVAESVGQVGHTGPLALADVEVLAAARGDQAAFARIYDRYGPRLYDFCAGMLRDPHAAADCVQDTFCVAARRLGQLRDPEKLRPWLYAIARHEALRRIRDRKRETASDDLPDAAACDDGPATLAGRNQLAALIGAAAGGLADRDRVLLDLHYRHGLDGPELAEALGVSHTAANTMVGRLRTTIERSLGALLIARDARAHPGRCAELDVVLADWNGRLTVLMRKRIARHLDRCPACDAVRARLVDPKVLLSSAPLLLPAPAGLRPDVLAAAAPLLSALAHGSLGAAGVAATTSWWPAAKGGLLANAAHGLHAVPLAVAAPLVAVTVALPVAAVAVHHAPAPASVSVRSAPTRGTDHPRHPSAGASTSTTRSTTSSTTSTTSRTTSSVSGSTAARPEPPQPSRGADGPGPGPTGSAPDGSTSGGG